MRCPLEAEGSRLHKGVHHTAPSAQHLPPHSARLSQRPIRRSHNHHGLEYQLSCFCVSQQVQVPNFEPAAQANSWGYAFARLCP